MLVPPYLFVNNQVHGESHHHLEEFLKLVF